MMHLKIKIICSLIFTIFVCGNCSKKKTTGTDTSPGGSVEMWLTKSDQSVLLQKQTTSISFNNNSNGYPFLEIDSSVTYQTIDGFGFALTGGSAYVINKLSSSDKSALLNELFGSGPNSIGVSYLRISIGASDLNASVYSYDDMPPGQTDLALDNFNLSQDTVDLIPLLKQILTINPNIKILGSPWSPPVWMKDNGNSIGGSLLPQYYNVYANYFVKYIRAMQSKGITINAITIQNEPQYGGNNPSMVMSAVQQADFIKNSLGPAFHNAGITTKIIIWDHNCNNPGYPITILSDPAANSFIDGSAFHLYEGDISALSTVHTAFPDKNLYFTEQWTGANEPFDGTLKWHIKNVIIGSVLNWSKVALEWNLASDANYEPHTPGGCSECKGAVTVSGGYTRNVAYYIIGQISKFVPPGSLRISSTIVSGLSNAAFLRPDGKKVLLVLNENNETGFNLRYKGKWATITMPASSVATFIW
ncbi:MAG: glucosylceramidase [Sphingobacteriales bacterium UTBCD1]|jgi:glucosylceramidase|nr:MAG: glucosylceramidase [Sphingobacteriales bacterium UTBCD1]